MMPNQYALICCDDVVETLRDVEVRVHTNVIEQLIIIERDMAADADFMEEAKKNPWVEADTDFIESALQRLELVIEMIEHEFNTVLLGERAHFDDFRRDCAGQPKTQVAFILHHWLSGIFDRYGLK